MKVTRSRRGSEPVHRHSSVRFTLRASSIRVHRIFTARSFERSIGHRCSIRTIRNLADVVMMVHPRDPLGLRRARRAQRHARHVMRMRVERSLATRVMATGRKPIHRAICAFFQRIPRWEMHTPLTSSRHPSTLPDFRARRVIPHPERTSSADCTATARSRSTSIPHVSRPRRATIRRTKHVPYLVMT